MLVDEVFAMMKDFAMEMPGRRKVLLQKQLILHALQARQSIVQQAAWDGCETALSSICRLLILTAYPVL